MLIVIVEGLAGAAAVAAMWLLLRRRRRHIGGAPADGRDGSGS